jgi:hypothetical protein
MTPLTVVPKSICNKPSDHAARNCCPEEKKDREHQPDERDDDCAAHMTFW